ncbi:MAG: L-threonylcarbamoyladenylate synthase [Bacteroidia bacterium]
MKNHIDKALEVLKNGGIILYPTDTIWGLGCDATNEKAVEKIFKIKKRSESKSLIILVDDEAKINRYIKHVPDMAWDIIEFAAKPTTVILDGAVSLAKNVIGEDGSVGIRVCKHPFCSELIRKFSKAIVSTSANISGEQSPQSFHDISNEVKSSVDYIVNLPEFYESKNPPSSIIKINQNFEVKVLRM